MSGRIFVIAGEASGDALAGDLIAALRARDAGLAFAGVGGPAMAAQGVESAIDIAPLSVLGIVEGLRAYGDVVRAADAAAEAAARFQPDAVVLVDSWGFTLRVAQRLRRLTPKAKLIKYVGPQVWATRAGRAKTLAATVDHLICIHDFEKPYYAPYGLACTVAGNPALGRVRTGDGAAFRGRHGLAPGQPVLLLAPGSRRSEIARIAPVFETTAARLAAARPDLQIVAVLARGVADAARARAARWRFPHLLVEEGEKEDAFAAATAALAASGTVTTEIAMQGTPVVVGYKIGWITWAIARLFLLKTRYITLMNVAAGREAAPEFVQTRMTPQRLAAALRPLLEDGAARAAQSAAQNAALAAMGRGGRPAAEIAAGAVLDLISAGR